MENAIKYFIGCGVPVFSCNFRCMYCYLGQHTNDSRLAGDIIKFSHSPDYIANYFSVEKLGGLSYFNFCASGETLLHPQIVELVNLLTKQGHYCDIITNGTISKKFDELIEVLSDEQKKHLLIKFSFHWLELKRLNLLSRYVENVKKIQEAGISFSIEITPHDELIPYIDEIKDFSIANFGALPHITVARNEATQDIEVLTKLSPEEYEKTWASFESDMFNFKYSTFGKKRCEFCYAGLWSLQLDLATGSYYQCYGGDLLGNIDKEQINFRPVGHCKMPHCFNSHAYMTYGTIPNVETPYYNNMRDRVCEDGSHWVQEKAREFFSTKLKDSHEQLSLREQKKVIRWSGINSIKAKTVYYSEIAMRKVKKRLNKRK